MNHYTHPEFWQCYHALPKDVRVLANKSFQLLKADPRHPSLHFKRVGEFWSARVGKQYRVLAVEVSDGYAWFWIGTHAEYDRLIS